MSKQEIEGIRKASENGEFGHGNGEIEFLLSVIDREREEKRKLSVERDHYFRILNSATADNERLRRERVKLIEGLIPFRNYEHVESLLIEVGE